MSSFDQKMLKEELIKIFGSDSEIPNVFNPDKLDLIDPDGVAFWDEMHRKCHNSTYGGEVKEQYIFARDEDGKYNGEIGTIDETRKASEYKYKYSQELRLALGMATKDVDGKLTALRLEPFDYTTTKMISKKREDELVKEAIT